ncbi:MAG TPA: GNAT family N-acetyltransferase [Anaerolineae bacterium]|nr:GNAT family N-acetyltransferase [Anaerolineae bacterium]HQK15141.1 GNAT family N-acetyltransferase [Anaerolineae bacterium]
MTAQTYQNYLYRPACMEDAESVTELFNLCSLEDVSAAQFLVEDNLSWWQSPGFNLEADTHVVLTPDGTPIGYADIWDVAPHVRLFGWARVHPDYRSNGIGTHLAQWLETRARESIPKAPEGTRVVLLQETLAHDEAAQALLREQGYRRVRYFFRMVIELDTPPPPPLLPEGITIRPFVRGQEERAVIEAQREAFKDHWGHVEQPFEEEFTRWMHWIDNDPDFDPSLWFIAVEGDRIVGMSLCSPRIAEDPDMGWIGTLGVLRPWRRQGVALALLHHSFGEFYRRGKRRVGLGVDADSLTGALNLYKKAGMHPVRQYANYEKELRPGIELSTQTLGF